MEGWCKEGGLSQPYCSKCLKLPQVLKIWMIELLHKAYVKNDANYCFIPVSSTNFEKLFFGGLTMIFAASCSLLHCEIWGVSKIKFVQVKSIGMPT